LTWFSYCFTSSRRERPNPKTTPEVSAGNTCLYGARNRTRPYESGPSDSRSDHFTPGRNLDEMLTGGRDSVQSCPIRMEWVHATSPGQPLPFRQVCGRKFPRGRLSAIVLRLWRKTARGAVLSGLPLALPRRSCAGPDMWEWEAHCRMTRFSVGGALTDGFGPGYLIPGREEKALRPEGEREI